MAQVTPDAERLVKEWVDIWDEGDYSKMSNVLDESVTVYDPNAPEGELHGYDEIEAYISELRAGFPDLGMIIDDMISSDDVVMLEWTVTGRHEEEFNDVPPTEREIEITGMSKILIADGKVQEDRIYFDRHELFEQLGLADE